MYCLYCTVLYWTMRLHQHVTLAPCTQGKHFIERVRIHKIKQSLILLNKFCSILLIPFKQLWFDIVTYSYVMGVCSLVLGGSVIPYGKWHSVVVRWIFIHTPSFFTFMYISVYVVIYFSHVVTLLSHFCALWCADVPLKTDHSLMLCACLYVCVAYQS